VVDFDFGQFRNAEAAKMCTTSVRCASLWRITIRIAPPYVMGKP
jgi:hypothetical protein